MTNEIATKIEGYAIELASAARAYRALQDEKDIFETEMLELFNAIEEIITEI